MDKVIRLALKDEHKIYRDGIRVAMKTRDHIKIMWEAEDYKEMFENLSIQIPDILLMDIKMPEEDAVKNLQLIKTQYSQVKVIILAMSDDKETVSQLMENGANAYLTKTTNADEIYRAIVTCARDDFYFNELVNNALLLKLQGKKNIKKFYPNAIKFNERELRILKLISEDKTTEEISEDVFLSPRTVETIRQNMKTKVGVKTIGGLMMYAFRNKLVK